MIIVLWFQFIMCSGRKMRVVRGYLRYIWHGLQYVCYCNNNLTSL